MDFETRAIHVGQEPEPATGAIVTPIYQTSTFVQEEVGKHKGYDYARVANPTRTALQECLASQENADHGVATSSGLGATTTLMHLVDPGQRVVLIADVYGGVYRMTSQVYEPKGYLFDYVAADEFPNLREHLDDNTRMVWVETPSNPLLNIVDIRAAADARLRRHGLLPRGVGAARGRARRAHEALPARRVARRRREPDRGAREDDARRDRDLAVRRAGEPCAPLGRDRIRRGPHLRPR